MAMEHLSEHELSRLILPVVANMMLPMLLLACHASEPLVFVMVFVVIHLPIMMVISTLNGG